MVAGEGGRSTGVLLYMDSYGCETWALLKSDIKRINAFEMKCYCKIFRIPRIVHRTNSSIDIKLTSSTNELAVYITYTFCTVAAASRVAEERHQFRGQRPPEDDMSREE